MRAYHFKAAVLSLLVVAPAWANAKISVCPAKKNNQIVSCPVKRTKPICCICPLPLPSWYADAGLGWVLKQKLGSSQLANIEGKPDQYNSPKVKQMPMGFISGGYVWSRRATWFPFTSLGLGYSYDMPARVTGAIEEKSEAEQIHSNYEYKIAHHNLRVEGKADLMRWRNWMPYLSAGLGASWNRFSNYNEEVIADEETARSAPEFANKTKMNFSYSVGTGVDYILTRNLWAGLGYRYDHFGKGQSGDTEAEFADKNLKNNSQAHTILISLRYLFG